MSHPALEIRLLENRDVPVCVGIYQQAYAAPPYGHGWDAEIAERIIRDLRRLFPEEGFVAEREGAVIGFILCSSLAGLRASIEEFCVAPAHQRQGVGRALLEHVIAFYQERGVPFLELVASRRAPAYAFYVRYGFSETEEYRLMSKEL